MYKIGQILGYITLVLGVLTATVLFTLFLGWVFNPVFKCFWEYCLHVMSAFIFIEVVFTIYAIVNSIFNKKKGDGEIGIK